METNLAADLVQRMTLLEARVAILEQSVHPSPPLSSPQVEKLEKSAVVSNVIGEVWQSAPLSLRLKFVRELLPEGHPVQSVLKEAAALEELRGVIGKALETWIASYPSLFAEAVERLSAKLPSGENAAEFLAVETLEEARRTLETDLSGMGIEWVLPAVGSRLTSEMEVVGDEPAPVAPGSVASVQRRGFRQNGVLALPAQVIRALPMREDQGREKREEGKEGVQVLGIGPSGMGYSGLQENSELRTQNSELNTQHPTPNTQYPTPERQSPPESWPDWLRVFTQRSAGSENAAVQAWAKAFHQAVAAVTQSASDTVLAERLTPLLALLGARHVESQFALSPPWGEIFTEARDGMLSWLRSSAGIELVSPSPGDPFDAATMQAVGVRRTAHPHENNTVARVEQVGLRRNEMPLFRAQVVRYELEAGL